MKMKPWRVHRHPVSKQWDMPDCPEGIRRYVHWILDRLEESPDGIVGYETMAQLYKFLMLEWWQKEGLREALYGGESAFRAWFVQRATFPDALRRAASWLDQQELVEIPPHIKKDARQKQLQFQGTFKG